MNFVRQIKTITILFMYDQKRAKCSGENYMSLKQFKNAWNFFLQQQMFLEWFFFLGLH